MESPEIWFEDFGTGQFVNCSARIQLESIFLESVTISQEYPLQAYVTLTGDGRGIWVEPGTEHFVVH